MKTSELTGAALDWAVAKCEGVISGNECLDRIDWLTEYSTDWAQGGPIIEREKLDLFCSGNVWDASTGDRGNNFIQSGPTPLIATMRCYVASKLGDYVEIPKELQQ